MAHQSDYGTVMAGMGEINLQDQVPSVPPQSDPPTQGKPPTVVPPPVPYNPSMNQQTPLQPQASLPDISYGRLSDQQGELDAPPPYTLSAPQQSIPTQQGSDWGHRASYPNINSASYMSLPRQMPSYQSPGVATPQATGYAQAYIPQQTYPQQQAYSTRPYSVPFAGLQQTHYVSPCRPNGYNILELFQEGNVIFLTNETCFKKAPVRIHRGKLIGGGFYCFMNTHFVVGRSSSDPSSMIVSLQKVFKNTFIAMDQNGKVITKSCLSDKCEFHVHPVGSGESSVVCLESAAFPGMFVGMATNGRTLNAKSVGPSSREARFNIRAHRIWNVYTHTLPLRAYGRVSVLNQLTDRCTIQLRNKASEKYLGINVKGRVEEIEDSSDAHSFLMVFDRGMGVISLRSWKQAGYWLRVLNGSLIGKGTPFGLEGDFNIKESYDGTVCLEPVNSLGTMTTPPGSSCYNFSLSVITVQVQL